MYLKIDWLERLTFQFSSVAHSCLTLCDPMDCTLQHQLLELAQTHVHRVSDATQKKSHFIYVTHTHTHIYKQSMVTPRWYSVWEYSCHYRGHGFNPWSRKSPWSMPQCLRAARPMLHNYRPHTLEPMSHNCWAHTLQLLKPMHLEPVFHNKRGRCKQRLIYHNKEQPPVAATGEGPCAAMKTKLNSSK